MTRYVPLSRRGSADTRLQHLEARHPGVPPSMFESLWAWIEQHAGTTYSPTYGMDYRGIRPDLIRQMERQLEFSIGWNGSDRAFGLQLLREHLAGDSTTMLDVAEYLSATRANEVGRAELEFVLSESGSMWRVGPDGKFVERVTAVVQDAADARFGEGTAGELLRVAWGSAFGRNPNPSDAYRHAVRAVEAAAKDVVLPKSPRPTLGTIIPALRDGAAKFQFAFVVDSKVKPIDVLVGMLEMLWTNQYDRHVNDDTPLHVSQTEAEAAVVLALTLVEWFASCKVARTP